MAFSYFITFAYNRTKVDSCILVSTHKFRQFILFNRINKAYEFFIISTFIINTYYRSVNKFNNTIAFSHNLSTRIANHLTFDTSTYNRSFRTKQWNCLTHHVRSHQCTVRVIVLQEWNQRSSNRSNLLRSNVHHIYFCWSYKWEVSFKTCFNFVTNECTIFVQRSITLSYYKVFFFLSCQVNNIIIIEVYFTFFYFTIRCRDETEVIDFCVDTQRRDQTNVWTLRSFNRTKTTIVSIVNVTNFETCTVTRKTTRTES